MALDSSVSLFTPQPKGHVLGTMKGVEIFAIGQHRAKGHPYSHSDLDEMVANFKLNKHLQRPPLLMEEYPLNESVISHNEGTAAPKVGRVDNLWRDGDLLKADLAEMPHWFEPVLKDRLYDKISTEVYKQPPHGTPGKGKTLRRVSFLGGAIPEIKRLNPAGLPPAVWDRHCETLKRPQSGQTVLRFAAVRDTADPNVFEVFSELVATAPPAAGPGPTRGSLTSRNFLTLLRAGLP